MTTINDQVEYDKVKKIIQNEINNTVEKINLYSLYKSITYSPIYLLYIIDIYTIILYTFFIG